MYSLLPQKDSYFLRHLLAPLSHEVLVLEEELQGFSMAFNIFILHNLLFYLNKTDFSGPLGTLLGASGGLLGLSWALLDSLGDLRGPLGRQDVPKRPARAFQIQKIEFSKRWFSHGIVCIFRILKPLKWSQEAQGPTKSQSQS